MNKQRRNLILCTFVSILILVLSPTVSFASRLNFKVENYELEGRKLFVNLTVHNNTAKRMIMTKLRAKVTVENPKNDDEPEVFNKIVTWGLNYCLLPNADRALRLYVGEIDPIVFQKNNNIIERVKKINEGKANNNWKIKFKAKSFKMDPSLKEIHTLLTNVSWDTEKKTLQVTLDVCNDTWKTAAFSSITANIVMKNSQTDETIVSKNYTWNDIEQTVPPYTQQEIDLVIPNIPDIGNMLKNTLVRVENFSIKQYFVEDGWSAEEEEEPEYYSYEEEEEDVDDYPEAPPATDDTSSPKTTAKAEEPDDGFYEIFSK